MVTQTVTPQVRANLLETGTFPGSGVAWGRVTRAETAGDAGPRLLVYVQISDLVTKVLIRKRFCRSPSKRELTNLET
ncbi:hypothetical protein SBA7_1210005 [Candidatus Sulfotelmatobacter sp. SbA7]|nr:hypothetical protein SBA7_1210005 [Candidatus Sulfotelmatobacter sp. SbA7]